MIYQKSWTSHIPLLVKVMEQSEGPVLELGAGLGSSPLLYWLCFDRGREFTSYESDADYAEITKDYGTQRIDDWDKVPVEKYGVVFIDSAPPERRHIDAVRFKDHADHIVIHDSQRHLDQYFHYKDIYPLFKYKYKYGKVKPHTTVLSNLKEFHA